MPEGDVSPSVDFFAPVTADKGPSFLLGDRFSLSSILVQGGGRLDIRQQLIGQCGRFKGAEVNGERVDTFAEVIACLLYTSPSPRDLSTSRMPSSA